jgi:hypothetical protein
MMKRTFVVLFLFILVLELPFCLCDSEVYMDKPVGKENGDEPVGGVLEPISVVNSTVTFIGLLLLLNLIISPRYKFRITRN